MGNFIRDRRTSKFISDPRSIEFKCLCDRLDRVHKICFDEFAKTNKKYNMNAQSLNRLNDYLFRKWVSDVGRIRKVYIELLGEVDKIKFEYDKLLPFTNDERDFNEITLDKKTDILNFMEITRQYLKYNIPEINKSTPIKYDKRGEYLKIEEI